MTKYKISCLDCKKEFIIDDEEFIAIIENMEKETQRLTSILHRLKVPVSYKSHDHVYAIVRTLMRCCASFNPEIYMTEVNEEEDRKFEELMKKCKEYGKAKAQLQVWTKKLGQRHYAIKGMSETICGMPMLGNNYANIIPESEQHECEECVTILEKNQHAKTED